MGAAAPTVTSGPGGSTAWLAARWLRRRGLAALPLLLIVLAGTTATILTLGTAQRTSGAFGRYLERANVGDVVVNPSVSSTEIDAVIRSLPGVTQVTTESLFMVTNDEGAPRQRRLVDQGGVESGTVAGVFGSPDGRYSQMDRPVVQAGRLPTGPSELALSATVAEAERWEIGDIIPLAFWRLGLPEGMSLEEADGFGDQVIPPIGVEHVELVGLIRRPDEVLPSELYPSQRAIVSPDIARRYDCLPPPPDPSLSLAENVARNQPPGCAVSYKYYSLSFADGPAGVKPALEEFVRRVRPLNERMATIRDTSGGGSESPEYFLITTETEPERRRVERAVRPTVTALAVLAAAAAAVTLALSGYAVAREVAHTAAAQRQWRQLGMTRRERTAVVATPQLAAVVVGVVGAVVASCLVGRRPVGVVSVLEPSRSLGVSGLGLLAASAIFLVAAIITVVLVARATRSTLDTRQVARRISGPGRLWSTIGSPTLADGLRAAYGQRGSRLAIAGSAIVCAALVAALVFGASLTSLVNTPRAYGWSWDLAAMTGGGYGDLDLAGARAALDDDPAVDTWTAFGFLNEISVDGDPMMSIIGIERETPEVDFPLLAGELPRRSDEIALGPATARSRRIGVGDTVSIGGPFEPVDATVTGIVVLPTIGPMFAGTVGGGEGVLVPQAMVDAVAPFENAAAGLATFVGVDLVQGADPAAVARVEEHLGTPDLLNAPPIVYEQAVRPPEIIEAAATRSVPVVVGAALAVVGALGLSVMSWASVRSRHRDLAVARALGFRPRQVSWSVRVQSLATTLAVLVVGVPLGVIAGRLSWQAFARQLGVVPTPSSAWTTVAVVIAIALLLALVAAELPTRRANRSRPAADLRAE